MRQRNKGKHSEQYSYVMTKIRSKKWRKFAKRFAIGYVAVCGLLYWQQQRLMFHPSKSLEHTPSLYQLTYQDLWIPVKNASGKPEQLHGWWIPAKNSNAPVILYFHHNAMNIGSNVSQALQFHKLGYTIVLFDYRGFGQSEGDFPTEAQVYEDSQAAWNYLTQTQQISPSKIVIYGHSIGGAIAIDLATKHPDAAALIVQNSFTSMRDMTKRFGLYWVLPIELLLKQRFESLEKMKAIKMPTLIIQGTEDFQIPMEMGTKLYTAAPEPKQLLTIVGGGHDNHLSETNLTTVQTFIQKATQHPTTISNKTQKKS
jgi:uncharacterized protein